MNFLKVPLGILAPAAEASDPGRVRLVRLGDGQQHGAGIAERRPGRRAQAGPKLSDSAG